MPNLADGSLNTAIGDGALFHNATGNGKVAMGASALSANTTGASNSALGLSAGSNLTTGSFNVDIANAGKAGEAKTIRIGNLKKQSPAFLAGVSGTTVPGAVQPLVVNSNGQLGTVTAAASAKSTVSARKFSRLQRQMKALREEVRQPALTGEFF
jgi:trimeric autotransporter adhesin